MKGDTRRMNENSLAIFCIQCKLPSLSVLGEEDGVDVSDVGIEARQKRRANELYVSNGGGGI